MRPGRRKSVASGQNIPAAVRAAGEPELIVRVFLVGFPSAPALDRGVEIHEEGGDLRVVSFFVQLIHPLEVFLGAELISGIAEAVQFTALPGVKLAANLCGGVQQLRVGVERGVAQRDDDFLFRSRVLRPGAQGRAAEQ